MSNMINSFQIRKEMIFRFENKVYECLDFEYKFARMGRFHQESIDVKARALTDDRVFIITFRHYERVEQVSLTSKEVIYMYESDENMVFMDFETGDMFEVPSSRFEKTKEFLVQDINVKLLCIEDEVIKVVLPEQVVMTVAECEEVLKGTLTSPVKNAVTETGLKLCVPLFILKGEEIVVSVPAEKYMGRA